MMNPALHVDMVNHPPHYDFGPHETIDVIEAWNLPYHLGNVVKYVSRAKRKGRELEDLKKASWYLNRYISLIENNLPNNEEPKQMSFMDDPESRRWFEDVHRSA